MKSWRRSGHNSRCGILLKGRERCNRHWRIEIHRHFECFPVSGCLLLCWCWWVKLTKINSYSDLCPSRLSIRLWWPKRLKCAGSYKSSPFWPQVKIFGRLTRVNSDPNIRATDSTSVRRCQGRSISHDRLMRKSQTSPVQCNILYSLDSLPCFLLLCFFIGLRGVKSIGPQPRTHHVPHHSTAKKLQFHI